MPFLGIPPPSFETIRNELLKLTFVVDIAFHHRLFFLRDGAKDKIYQFAEVSPKGAGLKIDKISSDINNIT
jgi:hypothetical protein